MVSLTILLGIALVSSFLYLEESKTKWFIVWITLILFIGMFIMSNLHWVFVKDFEKIGKGLINRSGIKIFLKNTEKQISFREIDILEIEINETVSDILVGNVPHKTGIENYFRYKTENLNYEYLFYLENREQYDYMLRFLKEFKPENDNKTTKIVENGSKALFILK